MLAVLSLVACDSESVSSNEDTNDFIENIGEKKKDVFENLNLEEGKDIEEFELAGTYAFKKEQTFHGKPLTIALTFDIDTDKLYGFMYLNLFEDGKDGYDLTKKLYEDLNKEYGNPTTYPGMTDRISEMPSYENIRTDDFEDYLEIWDVKNGLDAELRMSYFGDQRIRVALTYKVNEVPEDWYE